MMFETVPTDVLGDLRHRHAEPQRFYHDWSHVEALCSHLEAAGARVRNREAVLYAILFHDAVYDPRAKDNERQSAALLCAADLPLDPATRTLADAMILATEGHVMPDIAGDDGSDIAHFLDMDLGILGASEERFDIYEDQIRREYRHVPDEAFRKGRAAVLESFAGRERLYFSEWGRDRFEERARRNLARSLERLRA